MSVILSTCPPPTRERPKSQTTHVAPRLKAREWHVEERRENGGGRDNRGCVAWRGDLMRHRRRLQQDIVVVCVCVHVCEVVSVSLETSVYRLSL